MAPQIAAMGLSNATDETFTSDPSVSGRVSNESSVDDLVVELDYDGDGVVDEVTRTDVYGQFRITPVGLPFGTTTIAARASEITDDGQLLQSGWSSITFEYDSPAPTAATIDTLGLANDTGVDDTDGVTWDAQLAGQVNTVGLLPGATIEFDVDGDDILDGAIPLESDGSFQWSPRNLDEGAVTVRARTRQSTDEGLPLVGAWTSLTFTFEAQPDDSPRVEQLQLTVDSGVSATDKASSDPTFAGMVVNGTGAVVQIDSDGDWVVDATLTPDGAGNFSYTPEDLLEGLTTVRARVAVPATDPFATEEFSEVGAWSSLTFVFAADPDSAEAQAKATALATYQADIASADATYETEIDAAELAYWTSITTSLDSYATGMTTAVATRDSAVALANSTLRSAVGAASLTFSNGLSTVAADFAADLVAFTGDISVFQLDDFRWPDAPVANSW
ncbi:MAG: hypothetical protein KDB14_29470 [Planctomycetales bacterium]|nr:hypothetical protein [Planctomycetales bacterium]